MEPVLADLADQQDELRNLLGTMTAEAWEYPTRCEGWSVSDVVLHLAQTNEMAIASAEGRFAEPLGEFTRGLDAAADVDAGAASMVEHERGAAPAALLARWVDSAQRQVDSLAATSMSSRLPWVAGELAARTLATTRLAETWIHTEDVADALGVTLEPADRLRSVARLAWRTLPYAFAQAGRELSGPVALRLISPGGEAWEFTGDEPAATVIAGPAVEFCRVAARRLEPASTSLSTDGPDGAQVLELIRTYA